MRDLPRDLPLDPENWPGTPEYMELLEERAARAHYLAMAAVEEQAAQDHFAELAYQQMLEENAMNRHMF